jgi:hypothetical protein
VRCRAKEATWWWCTRQRWRQAHAHALHAEAEAASGAAAVWPRCSAACLVRTLVSERDAAQRRPRGEGVVPSGSGAGGPRARGGAARRHGGARTAGGRRCHAMSLVS